MNTVIILAECKNMKCVTDSAMWGIIHGQSKAGMEQGNDNGIIF